jgi:hypothetical protein
MLTSCLLIFFSLLSNRLLRHRPAYSECGANRVDAEASGITSTQHLLWPETTHDT